MPVFDPSNLIYVTPTEAAARIQSGWLAQYRGYSYLSRAIQYSTGGVHSHSAMLRRNGRIDVLEIRIGGGRALPFEDVAISESGLLDVFSISPRYPDFDGEAACTYMRHLTAKPYGYRGIARMALMRTPLVWRFWPLYTPDGDDLRRSKDAPYCSHAVCSASRVGGGIDPVPGLSDDRVTPNHLTWSLLWQYEFTVSTTCGTCPAKEPADHSGEWHV